VKASLAEDLQERKLGKQLRFASQVPGKKRQSVKLLDERVPGVSLGREAVSGTPSRERFSSLDMGRFGGDREDRDAEALSAIERLRQDWSTQDYV
jgi:hypothetical protein